MKGLLRVITESTPAREISGNFRSNPADLQNFSEQLKSGYYARYRVFDDSHDLRQDLDDQLTGRLTRMRRKVIPWLAEHCGLKGRSVLEIGCGTGSSLVAFAEQGALVTGLDIDDLSLEVSKKRLQLYGLEAELINGNAAALEALFRGRSFDLIIFSAALEHMTLEERLTSLTAAMNLLHPGGWLVVLETPNRLWHYDFHTSLLPFYFWLPDDLAFRYAHKSKRHNFGGEVYGERTEERFMHFLRRGRGVSYHDLELAFGGFQEMQLVSGMDDFLIRPWARPWLGRFRSRGYWRHRKTLMSIGPELPAAFYEPWLNLLFRKMG